MTSILPSNNFSLGDATRTVLGLKKNIGQNLIELGKWLDFVKLNIPKGEWMAWLRNDVHIPHIQAWRYIKISQEVDAKIIDRTGYTKIAEILELPPSKFREELLDMAQGITREDIRTIKREVRGGVEEDSKKYTEIIDQATPSIAYADTALTAAMTVLDALLKVDLVELTPDYIDLMYSQLDKYVNETQKFMVKLEYVIKK